MNKIFMVALLSLFGISNVFAAGFNGQSDKTSVAEALKRPDDSYVTVEGMLKNFLPINTYLRMQQAQLL